MPAERHSSAAQTVLDAAGQFLSSFKKPGAILVAVSGGSDSKGLLLALHEVIGGDGLADFSLCACTVDHGLRPESAGEARAVAAFCAVHGIPHIVRTWVGDKPQTGLQAAAREARYRLLAEAAEDTRAICVVTAHTANDQRETIVMRAGRSQPDAAGLSGMADGVLFDRRIWVLRPFLCIERDAIRSYLAEEGEAWFEDPSNTNRRFERVRIREDLAERTGSANTGAGLERLQSSGRAADLVSRYAKEFERLIIRLDPAVAENMDNSDCRQAVLSLVAITGGKTHLTGKETARRLAAFLKRREDGRMTAGRVVIDYRRTGVYLYREARELPDIVIGPGDSEIWDGRFRIINRGRSPVRVGVVQNRAEVVARLIAAGCPEAVAKRAAHAAPDLSALGSDSAAVEPVLSLYDTFLPRFDLMIADRIAGLFGREPYAAAPVHDVLTEKSAYT
ncbi:tRNA lysidine(34) synthetase TilS [Pararhizobium gei]|uniref:tRNA lysidine(34) synthetase TilS n=1 Tax=Pararhizobium gei TaxID=1395951 RepID=UPI0023DC290E|nr:tRNA lysidine(34) synthetase TilS [Rhizobium gei]